MQIVVPKVDLVRSAAVVEKRGTFGPMRDDGLTGTCGWTTAGLAFLLACLLTGPAMAATPFDGVYRGGNTPAGGGGARCPASQQFVIAVRDGVFTWTIGAERQPVTVRPDGTFAGQAGARFINGRIEGATMTAATSGASCNYTWSLTR